MLEKKQVATAPPPPEILLDNLDYLWDFCAYLLDP